MKRYDMRCEYNKYVCEDQVIPEKSQDGEWVKYKDIPKWISVEDRLPEDPLLDCLIFIHYSKEIHEGWFDDGVWQSNYPIQPSKISHWMPSIEPPEDNSPDWVEHNNF